LAKAHNRYCGLFRGVTRVTATINGKLQDDFYATLIYVFAFDGREPHNTT